MVLDASAAVELLLGLGHADEVAQRMDGVDVVHAPHILDIEVAQVVRRDAARGEVPTARAEAAVTDLADLNVHRHGHVALLAGIWRLRHDLRACDAAYIVLADAHEVPLVTLDARIAAAPGRGVEVDLVG